MTLDMDLVIMSDKKGITAQKMKFSIEDFFSKCDQIRSKLRIWSHLLVNCGFGHIYWRSP